MDYTDSPDYLKAADLHNVGSGNTSFFTSPIDYVEEKISGAAESLGNAPSFAVSSIASGINSIYNSGVVVGNFFGLTDATENDLQQTLGSYDSDLAKYYEANKQAADVAGFIVTSFAPGIGGVKLFNTGQKVLSGALKSGGVGRTLAEGTGLIPTLTADGKTLTQVAGEALAQGQQTFKLMDAGVLKAIAGGAAQATWESAAFESMVAATMFRSPILEGQDYKDIASNILTGAVLGGAIGGAIHAASSYGQIKKIITAADLEQKPFTLRNSQFGLENDPAARIIVGAADMAATPAARNAGEEALSTQRMTAIANERREAIHSLSRGDAELGNYLADASHSMGADSLVGAYQGAKMVGRAGQKIEAGEGNTVGYIKLHGEDMGSTTFDKIDARKLTLADKLKDSEAILNYVKSAGWTSKKLWDPLTASGVDEIQARYIWAEKFAKYEEGMVIKQGDIALQEGALRNKISSVTIEAGENGSYTVSNVDDLANEVLQNKKALANDLGKLAKKGWGFNVSGEAATDLSKSVSTITSEEIARAANVSVRALESTEGASMFARQDAQAAYDKMRADSKLSRSGETSLDFIPSHAAVVYDGAAVTGNSTTASALTVIKQQQKIQQAAVDRVVAGIGGEMSERLVHPGDKAILESNRYGAGAGLVTFSNGSFGSLASWAESVGKFTSELQAKLRGNTSAVMDSVALRLRSNQVAAIEFDKIRNLVASTTEKYVLNEAGDGLIAQKLQEYRTAVKGGKKGLEVPSLSGGAPDEIKFGSADVGDAVIAHIEANGSRVQHSKSLKNAIGLEDSKDPNVFYAHKPDPKDMPFFAFVKDETVTGAGLGHTSMIHAASAEQLEAMIKMAREKTGFTVYTKKDAEEFYKAQQSYDFDRTLHDNYIDSSLKSAGINNQFFPKTDPTAIVDEWTKWHARRDDILARETVATKFGHEFDQLETLGQQYTNVAGSRYAVNAKTIENTALNPYNDYRKTALNVSRLNEYPLLQGVNRALESSVSRVYQKITDTFAKVKGVGDLEKANAALEAAGVSHAYKNAAELILANHSAPKPYVSQFIRGANSILANTFLRLDPLNALNNVIGAQVLLGHETGSQVRALLRETAGITVPGTTDKVVGSGKLIAQAYKNYHEMTPELSRYYKENGWTTRLTDQYKNMLDDLALGGSENPAQLNTKLGKALEKAKELTEKGELLTGNRMAEELNRFVAADVGRQLAELRVKSGLMQTDDTAAYINTFVNRTQGNTLASQRPLIFQGPIGQAVGLFQTFQFNTMQQLFRGVSEGGAKDAAMLMGLQGTMYGLNGLPGFQYINQHIVGTASGNKDHTDAYSALYGAAGKTAGDWLMYGIPSNILQTNLYTRGDINPRSLTVIPTAPQDVVAVSAFAKFAGNLKETVSKITSGGDVWQSVLQGVEHNGLSRPLAGLAQTLQAADGGKVFSTTGAGDVSFANDFMSLATLSRLAGGKPLDEALANDELSRSMVYKAKDRERMKGATEVFKTSVIDKPGEAPDPAAVKDYMAAYVRNGGQAQEFNQTMLSAMTKVNTPKANQIIAELKGPYASHMKSLMGGTLESLE